MMSAAQLAQHIRSIEQGRTQHTAPFIDPVLAKLRAALAQQLGTSPRPIGD
jgi:hypothetical protein